MISERKVFDDKDLMKAKSTSWQSSATRMERGPSGSMARPEPQAG